MERIAPNEAAFASHLPDLAQKSVGEALAAGAAAKNHDVAAKEHCIGRKLDHTFALETRAVVHDRLGRQEFERAAVAHRQRLPHHRRHAGRAIDLLRRRGRDMRARLGIDANGDVDMVAGDEPARSGDERCLDRIIRFRSREQHA